MMLCVYMPPSVQVEIQVNLPSGDGKERSFKVRICSTFSRALNVHSDFRSAE